MFIITKIIFDGGAFISRLAYFIGGSVINQAQNEFIVQFGGSF